MNNDPYSIQVGPPSVETYLRLRSVSGLSAKTTEAAEAGLPNTWHGVTVLCGDDPQPVGMGRVIGDGGCFFQIVDICVTPEHQGRGLGKRIMAELVGELERRAPDGAYVSLIADGDARYLYEKFGFRQTAPASVGMHRIV
ncbi:MULTISPECIES: GNAT family N-acetyltransferase [Streptomyces]|uniref:GNAT family N-acetyltransferase n=1 Tax=Streptomyces TaxID=1883 RepID=UPI0005623415|nr:MULTISPECIES: GNAT family N-acetyltransferase [Streptomyces]AKL69620.1 AttT protein [Streptomyces sp. Mg1]RPK31971.1 Acetyltransferase (GNAT) family protein [Streptomyces sp. ADI91-18]WBY23912.1 GNAT family N-acetyltransferase [Streptomyces goshikiensis]WSS03000.1 GNAT family N-acetyltransferase [Streptomyces goshikiensis]WSS03439.1 GNAT family N-acetyltransferase [Streptomyces goshikiensis]